MTDLRQEAIRELEKLPEENISDIETINAMKELENNGGESFDTLDEFWNSLEK